VAVAIWKATRTEEEEERELVAGDER